MGNIACFFCCILFLPALSPICVAQIYVEAIYKSGLCSYSPSNKLHRSFCHGRWQRRFFYAPSNGSGLPPPAFDANAFMQLLFHCIDTAHTLLQPSIS